MKLYILKIGKGTYGLNATPLSLDDIEFLAETQDQVILTSSKKYIDGFWITTIGNADENVPEVGNLVRFESATRIYDGVIETLPESPAPITEANIKINFNQKVI